ncbi:hypothetical protein ACIQI7_21875 [Kitasatospora sp. NPDC092039]|uniref:hypothetical protein n=1 Tax=Kitasatospora sp. NPDC092039 TaxID=3364086 RepID=UPI0037F73598
MRPQALAGRHFLEIVADVGHGRPAELSFNLRGTGMRRGEILALHWSDVHLMDRKLYVRWTLAAVNNNGILVRGPKTEAGRAWISLSPRVMTALHCQAAIQMAAPGGPTEGPRLRPTGGLSKREARAERR